MSELSKKKIDLEVDESAVAKILANQDDWINKLSNSFERLIRKEACRLLKVKPGESMLFPNQNINLFMLKNCLADAFWVEIIDRDGKIRLQRK